MQTICHLLIITLSSAFLIKCSTDDSSPSPLGALIGTWEASKIVFSDCLDPGEEGTLTCEPYCIQVIINSNSTYSMIELDDNGSQKSETGQVILTSSTILLCESTEPNCTDPATYTLSGDILLVTEQEDDISGCQSVFTFERVS